MERRIGCAVLAFSLAACSGTSSGSIPLGQAQNTISQTHAGTVAQSDARKRHKKKVRIRFRIHVPNHKKFRNKRVRRRMTVSENTKGVHIVAYLSTDTSRSNPLGSVSADISPAACPRGVNDGAVCPVSLEAPPDPAGIDFVVTTYDMVPNGSGNIPSNANELGWGASVGNVFTAGNPPPTINLSLSSVLAQIGMALTPASLHTIIPSTATVSVYGLDADDDVIVSNGYMDTSGNALSIGLSIDNTLGGPNGSLSLNPSSLNAPSPTGVVLTYPGGYQGSGSTTVTISASTGTGINGSVTLNAVDPVFSSISDPNLSSLNPYHGGMVFDQSGGVYYTTLPGSGGISYYNSSGPTFDHYNAPLGQEIIGGSIVNVEPFLRAIGGTSPATFSAPPSSTYATISPATPAPVSNGSAMAYQSSGASIWYTSGTNLVQYPLSNAPAAYPIGIHEQWGVAVDATPSQNVWVVDETNDALYEESSGSISGPYALQSGGAPFDILANANGLFVTDHGGNPAILKVDPSNPSASPEVITVPNGAVPWYMMADFQQAGIVWFDYLINGSQIGLARMNTNVDPPTFSMATYNGAFGSQPGAIGAASNGLVYMVFENTQQLIQVAR
jgi:hypothetical protein